MADKAEELARERQEFEKWANSAFDGLSRSDFMLCADPRCVDAGKHYDQTSVDHMFQAWQASAALLRPHLGERGYAQGRLDQFIRMKKERPIDPIYWDMHEEAALRNALPAPPAEEDER